MADKIITQEDKNRVRRILDGAGLDWFRCEPGFRFLDSDDDECIVVGWGGLYRRTASCAVPALASLAPLRVLRRCKDDRPSEGSRLRRSHLRVGF